MILDQSQHGAFAQFGRYGGGSVWAGSIGIDAVLGPYRIAATDHHTPGSVATDHHTPGSVATDHHTPGSVATDSFAGEAV
jgi:hypothetical protein